MLPSYVARRTTGLCGRLWQSCTLRSYVHTEHHHAQTESEVHKEQKGSAVIITLNRPKALNALNLNMVRTMTPWYQSWKANPSQKHVVVMKGTGTKAFCAGGDIRAMYDLGKTWQSAQSKDSDIGAQATAFFREEYVLNHLIATIPQPHVALLNGITMGGGVGLSVHGTFRVATEHTVFAMPETGIGFFCDVGGSYFLPRLPGGLGLYLGLTGNRLKGGAVVEAGIATHYVPAAQLEPLQEALAHAKEPCSAQSIKTILDQFATPVPQHDAIPQMKEMQHCFGPHHTNLESIISALNSDPSSWAKEALKSLHKASPTSLRVVFRELHEGRKMQSLAECLKMENRIANTFMHPNGPSRDFFEGVRATLVDKDKDYKWNPNTLEKVPEEFVRPFFETTPIGGDLVL
eukprot:Phypoly_transcript_10225.p1 GENE.Phypoly_transcript_10225~~Phypoly_transcript_10225.p1  ORF type:complete len:404 (+),score=48.21 Phypoly_transcript_10225:92-1303(+)